LTRHWPHAVAALIACGVATFSSAAQIAPTCGDTINDPALAIQVCTRLIEFGSLDRAQLAKAYHARGAEWANQNNHSRAIADFDLAIELDSALDSAYYNRALARSHLGQADPAIADYDAVIRLKPAQANAYLGRAAEWISKNDYKRAIADFGQALRIDAQSSAAYFGRGRARFYAGEWSAAVSDLERAHQLAPTAYSALWLFLARKRAGVAAEQMLKHEASSIAGGGAWPRPVVELYLGNATPESVVRAATDADTTRQGELRCEASFYLAQWHLLRGTREPALQLLTEAESGCSRTFIEREGAVAELRRLRPKSP
jgi:lipoprotein NlpI